MWDAQLRGMADNKDKQNQTPDQQRQRTAQPGGQGDIGKSTQKGAPTAGNRDSNTGGKLPPDKNMASNDQLDVDVGDDKSPQRAPQPGTNNRP